MNGLLALAVSVLFALAIASAWLSYHAQVTYVLAHNGHLRTESKVWALLLDAGTAGVSLLRLYEALQRRTNAATRASLSGCITASVILNLLHTPSHSPGGYLVAAVPPVLYAVFLEHLLTNVRSLLVPAEKQRSMWRTPTLWINFPALMWNERRSSLRNEATGFSPAPEPVLLAGGTSRGATSNRAAQKFHRGRGPGPKRIAFEAALEEQVRSGDLRLFSEDERERNAAAYQAAASLTAPLSRGTARRYVVQALPRLEKSGTPYELPMPASALKSG